MQLLLDVDGVILNWVRGFEAWIKKNHFPEHGHFNWEKDNAKVDDYDICKRYGITPEVMNHYIKLFNNSLHFQDLPSIPGMYEALTGHIARGHPRPHTASSYSACKYAKLARIKNLKQAWPHFGKHHQLDLYQDKISVFKQYQDCDYRVVFIDDKPGNVEDALNNNIEAYLFNQPYNKSAKLPRISWKHLEERLK